MYQITKEKSPLIPPQRGKRAMRVGDALSQSKGGFFLNFIWRKIQLHLVVLELIQPILPQMKVEIVHCPLDE